MGSGCELRPSSTGAVQKRSARRASSCAARPATLRGTDAGPGPRLCDARSREEPFDVRCRDADGLRRGRSTDVSGSGSRHRRQPPAGRVRSWGWRRGAAREPGRSRVGSGTGGTGEPDALGRLDGVDRCRHRSLRARRHRAVPGRARRRRGRGVLRRLRQRDVTPRRDGGRGRMGTRRRRHASPGDRRDPTRLWRCR
jgi:hypothetical protein